MRRVAAQNGLLWQGRVRHFNHVAVFAGACVVTIVAFAFQHFVDDHVRFAACVGNDLAQRRLNGAQYDFVRLRLDRHCRCAGFSKAARARNRATPPPATTPSSTAARVACSASSTRSFFLFHFHFGSSTDSLITATPPANLATRSCSFFCRIRWLRFRFVGGFRQHALRFGLRRRSHR